MRIGSLRRRLTVQQKITLGSTNQAAYEPNEVWVDWKPNVPCGVSVRRGTERFFQTSDAGSGQRYSDDVYFFTVRYRAVSGIDSTMRIIHNGMVYDIRTIRPDEQMRREMVIECELSDAVIGGKTLTASIADVIGEGWVDEAYPEFTITASGGVAPYTYTTDSAGLAPGLSLDASTGIVSGVPNSDGDWPVNIQVMDAAGAIFALPEFNIKIHPSTP